MFAIKENTNTALHEVDQEYYLPTFKRMPLALERGEGCYVWDVEGNRYLDVLAGIAVNNLGHCHPKVVKAIQDQASKLMHISNFFVSEPQVELSKKLVEKSGLDRVFFSNSGAESVEGAFKIARKYAHSKGRGSGIIAMQNSFHGRTLATIATGKAKMQKGFGPMPSGFHRVPFNDLEAVKALISDEIAAIILEPIQGEGGIRPADEQYIKDLRALCNQEDIVLIFDEIQCGIARTGKFLATEHYDVKPDIITLAKGLGSGVAVGAILSNEKVSRAIDFGDHGTTFGGNPIACAAGLATIQTIEEENIIEEAQLKGQQLMQMLRDRLKNLPGFREVRGKGLMIGVEFEFETKALVMEMMKRRVLANATSGNVLRLVPPLIITESEMLELVDVIEASIHSINQ